MPWVRGGWGRFWFAPASSADLGLCRMLFFGALLLFYLPRDTSAWGDVSRAFLVPIGLFEALHLPVATRAHLRALQTAWKAALGLSCAGLLTRASTVAAFLLGTYLLGLPHNFGKIHHHDAIVVLTLGIMALARSGDAWSVDAVVARRRGARTSGTRIAAVSGEYRWPIRTAWVVMALAFFAAGASKVRYSGLAWVASDNLSITVLQNYYHRANADPLTSWGLYVVRHPGLARLLAAATLALELGFPLALVSRVARAILVPGAFAMLVGIRLAMGPSFEQFALCFVFWVPWGRLRGRRGLEVE